MDTKNLLLELDDFYVDDTIDSDTTVDYNDSLMALGDRIQQNTKRYQELVYSVVNKMLSISHSNSNMMNDEMEPLDVLIQQRLQLQAMNNNNVDSNNNSMEGMDNGTMDTTMDSNNNKNMLPEKLTRRYTVNFKAPTCNNSNNSNNSNKNNKKATLSVREARGDQVGKLIAIKGMVTRVSEVRPFMVVATYTCSSCHSEVFQEVIFI